MNSEYINVIGAGLAGCEAAWQIAERGVKVKLYDIKPEAKTPAHHTNKFAELVCSNSLGAVKVENAAGLLKHELRLMKSLIIQCADKCLLPAGGALAVDREKFSELITEAVLKHPMIDFTCEEVINIPINEISIIATGPLTTDNLSKSISSLTGSEHLFFHDAAAPVVEYHSLNKNKIFKASRYVDGEGDYINCPLNNEEYKNFITRLISAKTAEISDVDRIKVFEGCMPVEIMAKRGFDTLRFGPMKPVGLKDPKTDKEPYAVVQLRQDNMEGTLYNMVGFQTRLKWNEQKEVFRMIPGLENALFERYGVMHRNTYINSPILLDSIYRLKTQPKLFFAGQITGVEGYVESVSSGLVAGINAYYTIMKKEPVIFPCSTAIGALGNYISSASTHNFQPMNINYGLIDKTGIKVSNKKELRPSIAKKSLKTVEDIINI